MTYDITHWGEGDYFAARLALDAVGIIPIIGAIKYLKHLETATDIAKTVDKGADAIDTAHDVAKAADAAKEINTIVDNADVIYDIKKKAECVSDLTDDFNDYVDTTKKSDKATDAIGETLSDYVPMVTRNQSLENGIHPKTGVKFVRKYLDLSDGRKVTGVFPKFHSYADITLPKEYWKSNFNDQKEYLTKALQEMLNTSDRKKQLKKMFNKEELADIAEGVIPEGFVWHHSETEGLMQLVEESIHAATGHDGGMSLWGIGY